MTNTPPIEQLSPVAKRAWQRLESEFPEWAAHLDAHGKELEFALPAPIGSEAGHLVVFSHENVIWVRFSPPHLCYPADDENEMISLIKQLTADEIIFQKVMKGDKWEETTLTKPAVKSDPIAGCTVHLVSWSGRFDTTF
jgi:hypothetical protein